MDKYFKNIYSTSASSSTKDVTISSDVGMMSRGRELYLMALDATKRNSCTLDIHEVSRPVPAAEAFSAFNSVLRGAASENEVLKEIVLNLWNTYKYNQEYAAYLLEQYSDEEFYEIAEKYAVESKRDVDDLTFSQWINTILSTFRESLTSAELSVLSNIDCNLIESKLSEAAELNQMSKLERT